jgi:hypothetical protein
MSYSFGTPSKTHPGDMDFTTKKGNKVFHQKHHYVRKSRKPYTFPKRGKQSRRVKKGGKSRKQSRSSR